MTTPLSRKDLAALKEQATKGALERFQEMTAIGKDQGTCEDGNG
jgi:hypothetical protein